MIKTSITPENQDVYIHIPENYIGKQLEVILYPVDELSKTEITVLKKPSDFRGALKLTDKQYNDFQKHIEDIRNEWVRDI